MKKIVAETRVIDASMELAALMGAGSAILTLLALATAILSSQGVFDTFAWIVTVSSALAFAFFTGWANALRRIYRMGRGD